MWGGIAVAGIFGFKRRPLLSNPKLAEEQAL